MSFLVQGISRIKNPQDRAYLAFHALHSLRLEEVLGLKEKDIDIKKLKEKLTKQRIGATKSSGKYKKGPAYLRTSPQKSNNSTKKKHPCVLSRGVSVGADDRI